MAPIKDEPARQEAVDKAISLFTHVATIYHENQPTPSPSDPTSLASEPEQAETSMDGVGWLLPMLKVDASRTMLSPIRTPKEKFDDELRRYLAFEGGMGELLDPLGWWKIHADSFPTIARMARDYLAIPATSVSVERTFSQSRHICADLRMSLKAETIREALLSKVWIKSGLFEVNEPVRRKRKHGQIS